MKISKTYEETNIISLSEKRIERGQCKHHTMIIDQNLEHVKCNSCGELLNPISVLARFAREEKNIRASLIYKERRFDHVSKKLSEKCRTKYTHCQKMTPVNIKMSDLKWRGW